MSYQIPSRSTTWIVLESVTLLTLDFIILIGNLMICYVIYKRKPLRTMTNMLIIALALNDLVTACITLPMATTTSISSRWMFGNPGCQIFGFFSKYLVHVSLYIITLIALNRYIRIITPSHYRGIFTLKKTLGLLSIIWSIPAVVRLVPVLTGSARFVFVPRSAACTLSFYEPKSQLPYTIFATVIFIALPMLTIIVCYASVNIFVRKHRQQIFGTPGMTRQPGALRVSVNEVKITYTLFAVAFTFVICWLPVSVALLFVKAAKVNISTVAVRVLNALVALSSASTPFVYGVLNRPFRQEFKKVFPSLFNRESDRELELNRRDIAIPPRDELRHNDVIPGIEAQGGE
ncbi:hypothetical protein QZH41_001261 [Actinostola sp. cb2023]|nr:hypothetical protein QZH41_001261 [Actinostola sp. cb2023]